MPRVVSRGSLKCHEPMNEYIIYYIGCSVLNKGVLIKTLKGIFMEREKKNITNKVI